MAPRGTPYGAGARRSCAFLLVLVGAAPPGAWAFGEAQKYLIVSSPSTSSIAYIKLPSDGAPAASNPPEEMRTLINTGLTYPQGIAVDEYRQFLYVADPGLGRLVRYPLLQNGDALTVGKRQDVASPVEVRAVSVDGLGNVWFTDEGSQRVMRVTAQQIAKGHRTPQTVYDSAVVEQVRSPGGIAADSFYVYWLNKAHGTTVGSLIKAKQNPSTGLTEANSSATASGGAVQSLASNAEKCYGVCSALGNLFYSDEFNKLYGVPRTAVARGEAVTISSHFKEPRGCAFDGDGTVYVADKAGDGVYQFASNMDPLQADRPMTRVANLQGPFGVAVFSNLLASPWN